MRNKEQRINKLGFKLMKLKRTKKRDDLYKVVDKRYGKRFRSFEGRLVPIFFKDQLELETWVSFQEQHGRFFS